MVKRKVQRSFDTIMDTICSSGSITMVSEKDLKILFGRGLGGFDGVSYLKTRIICLRQNKTSKETKTIIWHEVAHILFPNKPHWWIECFALKMTGSTIDNSVYCRYAKKYCHSTDDLGSKKALLEMAIERVREIEK